MEMAEVMNIFQEMYEEDGSQEEEIQDADMIEDEDEDAPASDSGAADDSVPEAQEYERRAATRSQGRDLTGFNEGVREAIYTPSNERTAQSYAAVAKDYLKYCQDNELRDIKTEANICNYFHERVHVEKQFGLGSIWNKYSGLNNYFQHHHGIDLNTYRELRTFMTNITAKYVPKKSGTMRLTQFKLLLDRFRRRMKETDSNPDNRLYFVTACILWFGLLRGKEAFLIDIQDVQLDYSNRSIRIMVTKATKTRKTGFSYVVPSEYFAEFSDYMTELGETDRTKRFLRYYTKSKSSRGRNAGRGLLQRLVEEIEDEFPELEGILTNHLWRRSAATAMADSGANSFQIKVAGRWNNIKTAEGYVATSLVRENQAMNLLNGRLAPILEESEGPEGVLEDIECKETVSRIDLVDI